MIDIYTLYNQKDITLHPNQEKMIAKLIIKYKYSH